MARARRRVVAKNGEDNKAGRGKCKDNEVGGGNDGQDDKAAGGGKDKESGGSKQQLVGQGESWHRQLVKKWRSRPEQ